MQAQATQKQPTNKMSRLDEYRLWAMICDNELNADLKAKGLSLSFLWGSHKNGGMDVLAMRRLRWAT